MEDERIASIERRLAKHGEELDELKLQREHDSVVLAQVNATCLEIKQRLCDLEKKPATRWESVTGAMVNAVVLAVLAYILAELGLR